jgi:hypothetical protein
MCPFTHQEGKYRGLCLHSVLTSTLIAGDWIPSGSDRFALITLVVVGRMSQELACVFWRREKSLRYKERLPDHPTLSVVTVLTELSRLPHSLCVRLIGLSEHN